MALTDRLKSAWNAFSTENNKPDTYSDPGALGTFNYGGISTIRPERNRSRVTSDRTMVAAIYARMAIDIAAVTIRHTRHDDADRYEDDILSGLNDCLNVEANVDQGARAFRQDIVLTMFDKGVAAIVPVDTTVNPEESGSYDIRTLRVGEVVQWYPQHVRVSLYNEIRGIRQEIVLRKRNVAIVENPLYSVMNEPNSTLQRLLRKLSLLDAVDEASSSGKLDLIIQLPYVIKSEARRQQADQRRQDIEVQLKGSQYGIAYTDGTEKITQLNRPTENQLLPQIEYLMNMLYSQLGITPEVMNGTADEKTMLNYNNRTIEPIMAAITEAMKRTFLTKTARTQGQSIDYFREPFKLVPMADLAELADKLARNEIVTSNEVRGFIGLRPSKDPKADLLINSNMPQGVTGVQGAPGQLGPDGQPVPDPNADPADTGPADTSVFDGVDEAFDAAYSDLGLEPPPEGTVDPPTGELDPNVELDSLDEMDAAIDEMFAGLEDL